MFKKFFQFFSVAFDEDKENPIFKDDNGYDDVKVDYDSLLKDDKEDTDADEKGGESDDSENQDDDQESDDKSSDDDESDDNTEGDDNAEEDDDVDENAYKEGSDDGEDGDGSDGDGDDGSEDISTLQKRLKDTQRALHQSEDRYKKVEAALDELKKKIEGKSGDADKGGKDSSTQAKDGELSLLNIDRQLLEKHMKENPVGTIRWIVDQQSKLSLAAQKEAEAKAVAESKRQQLIQESEDKALKDFPVLAKALEMTPEEREKFQKESPEQYDFVRRVTKYYKQFIDRGDDEALLNAALRVYKEMSPEALKKLQKTAKETAKKELTHKKKVLGKVKTSTNKGKGSSASAGFKKLSASEFAALSPKEQNKYMEQSVLERFKS